MFDTSVHRCNVCYKAQHWQRFIMKYFLSIQFLVFTLTPVVWEVWWSSSTLTSSMILSRNVKGYLLFFALNVDLPPSCSGFLHNLKKAWTTTTGILHLLQLGWITQTLEAVYPGLKQCGYVLKKTVEKHVKTKKSGTFSHMNISILEQFPNCCITAVI